MSPSDRIDQPRRPVRDATFAGTYDTLAQIIKKGKAYLIYTYEVFEWGDSNERGERRQFGIPLVRLMGSSSGQEVIH